MALTGMVSVGIKERNSMVRTNCDICAKRIEATDDGSLARVLGLHKRMVHGIRGKFADQKRSHHKKVEPIPEALVAATTAGHLSPLVTAPLPVMQMEDEFGKLVPWVPKRVSRNWRPDSELTQTELLKRQRQRRYRAKYEKEHGHSRDAKPDKPVKRDPFRAVPSTEAEPCKLSECPKCGARFYVIGGNHA